MNPSSIAWRIEYRWNGSCLPVAGFLRPNNSRVRPLGVAVNAKNDRFACWPRAPAALANASSTASTGSAAEPDVLGLGGGQLLLGLAPPSTSLRSFAASPVCEECASSTITA